MSILGSLTGGLFDVASGNNWEDTLDPGNFFHKGSAEREANKQWQLEYQLSKQNFEEAKDQNEWNRNMQQLAFDYQKQLNETQMLREDTSVARRVADLKSAGLSPTLAAGTGAAAAPMHAGSFSQVSPAQQVAPSDVKAHAAMFKEQMTKDRLALVSTLLGNFADVSKTMAETKFLDAQTNQMNAWTPVDLKLKEQLYEFNREFNPYRLEDMIAKIENTRGDTFYKERQSFLVDSQKLLNDDQHGLNALIYAGKILDNEFARAKIDYQNQEYVKNAIAIELLRSQYHEYEYSRGFYNKKWGVPVGFNLSPWTSYFGYKPHEDGNPFGAPALDKFNPWDKTPGSWNESVRDFVSRTVKKADHFLESVGLKSLLHRITGGVFNYSE